MEEGKLDSQELSGADQPQDKAADTSSSGLKGRFRNPIGADIELGSNLGEEEDAIAQVAKRFRGPGLRFAPADAPSLDGQSADASSQSKDEQVSEDELQGFLLDALDAAQEPALDYELEEFEAAGRAQEQQKGRATSVVEPAAELSGRSEAVSGAPARPGVTCGSCQAVNPPGMRFCVQCGGGLKPDQGDGSSSPTEQAARQQTAQQLQARRKPAPPSALAQQPNPWNIQLISINEDGSDGSAIALEFLETTLGAKGDTRFPTDAFLSPSHARLYVEDGELFIEDLESLNGTFLKLNAEIRLRPGDAFLMGRQVLRFERFEQPITSKTKSPDGTRYMGSPVPGGNFKIVQVGIGNITQNIYCLPASGAVLGREKGDIIFPHDKFMSSRHAQIYQGEEGDCHLVDLNSSNGTWIRLLEKTRLRQSDYIFMGQQLFRVHLPKN